MIKRLLTWFFYYANLAWVHALMQVVASKDLKGRENVPRKGALIMTCNHMNNADPPVIGTSIPRRISWLTKAEWFRTPVIGWLFKMSGMIPVRRFEADLHALRDVSNLLKDGGCLGMFPEGTRSKTKHLNDAEPGSAYMALRTGAPILPVALWGTEDVKLPLALLKRTRVHVRIGKPYTLEGSKRPSREEVAAGTERIMREIAALLPEKYRGKYGQGVAESKQPVETNP